VASWLEGPGAVARRDVSAPARGQRLGLPPSGPGSVAGLGPRLVAFAIDTVLCALLAWLLARDQVWTTPVFAVEVAVLTWLVGGSAGQVVRRLRVVRVDGRPLGAPRALLRTLLLLLFIPAVVWDRDGRGLHDRAAGSVVVHAGTAGS
jgi:uncharacterized RDD family membrane protein YckC